MEDEETFPELEEPLPDATDSRILVKQRTRKASSRAASESKNTVGTGSSALDPDEEEDSEDEKAEDGGEPSKKSTKAQRKR